MPEKDGTGPKGQGPMTGQGRGKCVIPLNTKEEERNYLENQVKILRKQLETVESRLKVLDGSICGGEKRI